MDDPNLHNEDDQLDNDDIELDDNLEDDDLETPANTDDDDNDDDSDDDDSSDNDDSDDSKNADAEEVKAKQKKAWLNKIKSGKKALDDMPDNLGWLKDEIKKDFKPAKKKNADDISKQIDKALDERDAKRTFNAFVEGLESSDMDAEQGAQLGEEYEDIIEQFSDPTESQKLKALTTAARLVGLKDISSYAKERKRKGMILPPIGSKKRKVTKENKEKTSDMDDDLPRGYSAKRPKKKK